MIQGHYALTIDRAPDVTVADAYLRSEAIGKPGVTAAGNEDGGRGLMLGLSDRYHLKNLKIFTVIDQEAGKGKDAMNLASSSDSLVEGCLTLSGDDTYAIKGRHDDEEWLQVDLGRPVELDRVVLRWGLAYWPAWRVLESGDGVDWTELGRAAVSPTESVAGLAQAVSVKGRARYLRVQAAGKAVDFYHGDLVRALEVYGAARPSENLAGGRPASDSGRGQPWTPEQTAAAAVDGDPQTSWARSYRSERVLFRNNIALVTANAVKIGTGADYGADDITWIDHDIVDAGWMAPVDQGGAGGGMLNFSHYNFDHVPHEMAMRRIRVKNTRFEATSGIVEVGWYFWRKDESFIFATDLDADFEDVTFDHIEPGRTKFRVLADPATARIRMTFTNLRVAGRLIHGWDDLRSVGVVVDLRGLGDDDSIEFFAR